MSNHNRLYDSYSDAMAVIGRLRAADIDEDDISVISPHDDKADTVDSGPVATVAGSGIGAVLGGGAGTLAGLGLMSIPGLGPVVAVGWFAATLAGLAAGTVAGGVAGGIVDALTDNGLDAETAQVYAEGIRRGGTLVTVRADDSDDVLVARLLDQTPSVDIRDRERRYRDEGWTGFAPTASEIDEATRQRSA